MKTTLLFLLCAAGCFTGGYFAGKSGSGQKTGAATSRIAQGAAGSKIITGGSAAVSTGAGAEVREFQPGRPFAPGGAKAWLLSLAAKLKESGGNDFPIELVDLAQVFMTMDEGSITEVSSALKDIMDMLKADDPALKEIEDLDEMLAGGLIVSAFRLSQLNTGAAMDLLKGLSGRVPDEMTSLIFARLASKDPVKAEAMLAELPENQREDAIGGIIHGMMGRDPAGALALMEKHPEHMPSHEMNRLLNRMIERDPAKGMAAAARLTEKRDADVLLGAYANWQQRDKDAAKAWALNYKGPGEVTMRGQLLQERAAAEPEAAAQEFLALQKQATERDRLGGVAQTIANKLADKDVTAAAAWAETLPPGDARSEAMQHSMERWLVEDSTAASVWLDKQPQGVERDRMASQLVGHIRRRDPAAAFEWARNMQDNHLRRQALSEVMEDWNAQEPEAAKAALQSLPEAMRKEAE